MENCLFVISENPEENMVELVTRTTATKRAAKETHPELKFGITSRLTEGGFGVAMFASPEAAREFDAQHEGSQNSFSRTWFGERIVNEQVAVEREDFFSVCENLIAERARLINGLGLIATVAASGNEIAGLGVERVVNRVMSVGRTA